MSLSGIHATTVLLALWQLHLCSELRHNKILKVFYFKQIVRWDQKNDFSFFKEAYVKSLTHFMSVLLSSVNPLGESDEDGIPGWESNNYFGSDITKLLILARGWHSFLWPFRAKVQEEEGCLESSRVSWKIIRYRHDSLPFCNIQLFFFLEPQFPEGETSIF